MKVRLNFFMILLGILLIMGGICLFGYNMWDSSRAKKESDNVLKEIKIQKEKIKENTSNEFNISNVKIDEFNYIGTLTIPKINLELPVIDSCNEKKLKKAPCLYDGSAEENNMIVAAHAYLSHFGKLKKLKEGDNIIFEDLVGNIFEYYITDTETLSSKDVEKMKSGDWDLTLFTCTLSGNKRVTIRAKNYDYIN